MSCMAIWWKSGSSLNKDEDLGGGIMKKDLYEMILMEILLKRMFQEDWNGL